ncbi:Uma2 family endonuclease [Flavobacterium faecale]
MVTNINQLDFEQTYSYAEYLTWLFEDRVELHKGKLYKLGSAPGTLHQKTSSNLTGVLCNCFKKNSYNLFSAPFDVRLLDKKKSTNDSEVFTVVQPDLCIICDDNKLDQRGAFGAPDLVIEILSPGNSKKELKYKFDLYEEAGVLEYWIVNPIEKTFFIYVLKNDQFIGLHPLIEEDTITSPLFPQLDFVLEEIFK